MMNVREHMPVKNLLGEEIGDVVEADDQYLEIVTRSDHKHYWVPVELIERVDNHVHLRASGDDLSRRWLSKDPAVFLEDMVDEASEESFPASDSPSFNPQKT